MENKQPKVINESGTTRLNKEASAAKEGREGGFRGRGRRDNRRGRRATEDVKKEFDSVNISINRVSRTVAGGRRMRFQALVAIGNHKNKVGVGMAKGNDVTTAVQKAERRAKKNMITFNLDGETICHEVETKVTGANILMKPAAPGTGIIAGGVIRSIIGLTGVKNLVSKSLGSTNKANIAYAVIEGLRQQTPRSEWLANRGKKVAEKADKKVEKADKKSDAKKATKKASAKEEK